MTATTSTFPNYSGRGITVWNINNQYTIPLLTPQNTPNDRATLVFTCTKPKCYMTYQEGKPDGRDACNILFNAYRTGSGSIASSTSISWSSNNMPLSGCDLSGVAQNGASQGFDLGNAGSAYNDVGYNTFVIYNNSPSTIKVDQLKVVRTYKMCDHVRGICPYCYGSTIICDGGSTLPVANGNLDEWRVDKPCSAHRCGGLSYTQYHDISKQGSILPAGSVFQWTFDFSTLSGYNYVGSSICIFNFNGMSHTTQSGNPDVSLIAKLNGNNPIGTFYFNRNVNAGLFPSIDLAKYPIYDDDGANTVQLLNNSNVSIQFASQYGGIDVYRIFQTEPLETCPQNGPCTVGCEVSCQSCATSCQVGCEVCENCYGCQAACQFFCVTCDACNGCYSCNTGCDTCVSCQPCEGCQTGCEVNCQTGCQVTCQTGCELCQSCYQDCYGCYQCETCQDTCELGCQNCQTGCETCQDCQDCNTCQGPCQTCQTPCESCASCYQDCYEVCYEYTGE